MIPGDGIGPEISQSVKDIFSAAGVINGLCIATLYIVCMVKCKVLWVLL